LQISPLEVEGTYCSFNLGSKSKQLHWTRPNKCTHFITKNPGPGQYSDPQTKKRGYSMRPMTAKPRICTFNAIKDFTDNK
jgi:hypothetical protein